MIAFLSRITSHAVAVISVDVSLIPTSKLGRFNLFSDEQKEAGGGKGPIVCIAKRPHVAKEINEQFSHHCPFFFGELIHCYRTLEPELEHSQYAPMVHFLSAETLTVNPKT